MKRLGQLGFTLLEMLTVLTILAVVTSIAVFTMHDHLTRAKLRTTIETIASDVRQARWQAQTRSLPCTMVFDTATHTYTINGSQQAKLPEGLRFGVDPSVTGKPNDPYEAPPADGVSFNSGVRRDQTRFYPTGTVSPTGAIYITDGKETMVVTVAITGRPKIWRSTGGRRWVSL